MNKHLQKFARDTIKQRLLQCSVEQRLLFKQMYFPKDLTVSVDAIVNDMDESKLDWAMQQVEATLDKNKREKKDAEFDEGPKCGDCPHTVKISELVPEWEYGVNWYGECDLYYDGRHADVSKNPICKVRRMELELTARAEKAETENKRLTDVLGYIGECYGVDIHMLKLKARQAVGKRRMDAAGVEKEKLPTVAELIANPPAPTEKLKELMRPDKPKE